MPGSRWPGSSMPSSARRPASGPSASATATARLSRTTGESASATSSSYRWTMRGQSVASGRGAIACSAAISACTRYGAPGAVDVWRQQLECLRDLLGVPARPVLVGQQHQPPVDHPGVASRVLQQHQREQTVEVGAAGQQLAEQPGQPDRLGGEVGAHQVRPRRRRVAGGEREVGDVGGAPDPRLERGPRRHLELLAGQALARTGEPRRHRRGRHQEQPGDVGGRAHPSPSAASARRRSRATAPGARRA